jgi:hypothetical protein
MTTAGSPRITHRLALAVVCIDATNPQRIASPVQITREFSPRQTGSQFIAHGPGRALLLHDDRIPSSLTVRIDSPSKQLVPRRVSIPLWTLTEVSGGDAVPAVSRVLAPWLLPGTAYPLVRGTTALRGQVLRNGTPVRWPRILAVDPSLPSREARAIPYGWAHGDERGEFVLVLNIPHQVPTMPEIYPLALEVSVPAARTMPRDDDPLSDLVIEKATRTGEQSASDADVLLEGRAIPPGYQTSPFPVPAFPRIGALTPIDAPLIFPL